MLNCLPHESKIPYIFFLLWFAPASNIFASITIDSTFSTISTCQANGSIAVYASGTDAPFIYSITSGPLTRPAQSGNIFAALPAASTYTIQVQNQSGETATLTNVTVPGNYAPMQPSPYSVPSCSGSSLGKIVGNMVSGGLPPYTWQLISPSPVTTLPQASDTFSNLPDGSYTINIGDACGNFQTKGAILTSNTANSFSLLSVANTLHCGDSGEVFFQVGFTHLQLPVDITVYDDQGDSVVLPVSNSGGYVPGGSWALGSNYIQVTAQLKHSVWGECPWHAIVTDFCGNTYTFSGSTGSIVFPVMQAGQVASCPPKLSYSYNSRNIHGDYTYITPSTLDYYLIDSATQTVVESGTAPDPNLVFVNNGINGRTYQLFLVNPCGDTFPSLRWVWESPAPPIVYINYLGNTCLDSTVYVNFSPQGFSYSYIRYIISGGPSALHSTKSGFGYSYALNYPDTFLLPVGDNGLNLGNMPPGTYHYSIEDSCGQKLIDSFTIKNSDIENKTYSFNSSIYGQCGVFNAINLSISRGNQPVLFPYPQFTYTIKNLTTGQILETVDIEDSVHKSINNIVNGTYALEIDFYASTYSPTFFYLNGIEHCTTIYDTLLVDHSQLPIISGIDNSFCRNNISSLIHVDSSGGVPPFTYEIISGTQTFPPQSGNTFLLPAIGTYVFRVADACGNSTVSASNIDTLKFPPIALSGTPCPGANVQLIAKKSPFYTYRWKRPDGTYITTDTLFIYSMSSADTGIYTVTRYADIISCKDTATTTIHLELLSRISQSAAICYGDTLRVGNMRYTQAGTYTDTLQAVQGCDSIVTTTLAILPRQTSSQALFLCPGKTFFVGPVQHSISDTTVHQITDTIASSLGCDSIVTTNLTWRTSSERIDTAYICTGETLIVQQNFAKIGHYSSVAITSSQLVLTLLDTTVTGCDSFAVLQVIAGSKTVKHLYDTVCSGLPGVYSDTVATSAGCDSITILHRWVKPLSINLMNRTICAGQSFQSGAHSYSATGVYRDTLMNINGCDSIVSLHLKVTPYLSDTVSQNICSGQSVAFGGNTYGATGTYSDTVATGTCDSIHVLLLTAGAYKKDSIVQSICAGQSVVAGIKTYTATGVYRDTFPTANCDSIRILDLRVTEPARDTVTVSFCAGQSITIEGNTYTSAGMYSDTFATTGCDSIRVLQLTQGGYKTENITQEICNGQSIRIGAKIYSTTGMYTDTFSTPGCDSIRILHLQVKEPVKDTVNSSICHGQSITIGTKTYAATGLYIDTFTTTGCDSIRVLQLTVGGYKTENITQVICNGQSITIGTKIYNTAGVYIDTFSGIGCDSIRILNLQTAAGKRDTISRFICAGESITAGGNTYNTNGIYSDTFSTTGCDSIRVLLLTVGEYKKDSIVQSICTGESTIINGHIYLQEGDYIDTLSTASCDSIIYIHIATFPQPGFTVVADRYTVNAGDTVRLYTNNSSLSYHWTSGATISDVNTANPFAIVNRATWIWALATDSNNCTTMDSIFISMEDCEETIYVPNVFSPNADGRNDIFRVFGNCIHFQNLMVFNRWGEKVWETNDMETGWDGYYNGVLQLPGTYVYLLNYATRFKAKKLKGSITLVR
jgi:gliding motility-associated-like protein